MAIALFAIIGATINAGVWYWICFGVHCLIKTVLCICEFVKILDE